MIGLAFASSRWVSGRILCGNQNLRDWLDVWVAQQCPVWLKCARPAATKSAPRNRVGRIR
jgi:hypothetical protein